MDKVCHLEETWFGVVRNFFVFSRDVFSIYFFTLSVFRSLGFNYLFHENNQILL